MSVTFYPSPTTILGWDIECACGNTYLSEEQAPMTYKVVEATLARFKAENFSLVGCEEDCLYYGNWAKAIEDGPLAPEVNMANGNSYRVLEALGLMLDEGGFSEACVGSLPAEDFLGRVLMALAVAPRSAERPTYSVQGDESDTSSAVMIMCGVGEGYLQERLEELRTVAEFAVEENRKVLWS